MLEGIQNMIAQESKLVEDAKHKYFTNVGRTFSDPSTGTNKYWYLIYKEIFLQRLNYSMIISFFNAQH